ERVWVGPSCSLLHSPVDLEREATLDPEVRTWLAFAIQKLDEICALASAAGSAAPTGEAFERPRAAPARRRRPTRVIAPPVRARLAAVTESQLRRSSPFAVRAQAQHRRLGLPTLPTTTIGSFPQTGDVRGARAAWRAGKLSDERYHAFLRDETRRCVAR